MTNNRDISIHVPVLARVEGEGALHLQIEQDAITDLRLQIYEPPRFFEKFLEGRHVDEVPDIVARICGICPVAYQMSAVHALEKLSATQPGQWVHDMRRLMYCGEWIESHSLHIHLLAAPDFLGYSGVPAMAVDYPQEVRRGLRLQAVGNDLIKLLGGRSVHPVGVRLGGFHAAPSRQAVESLEARLADAIHDAAGLVAWTATLPLPDDHQDFTCIALRHERDYPMNEGRLQTTTGQTFAAEDFEQHIREHQVAHSTALHASFNDRPYLVGPLARINLNHDRLPDEVQQILRKTGIRFPSHNMFHSIVARAVEILYALMEARRLLQAYTEPGTAFVTPGIRAGTAAACTEAPRGILWHRYRVNDQGLIERAVIVPPTSQNQARIEQDLRTSLQTLGLQQDDDVLRLRCEKIIRNYDPCISCATHFLQLHVSRR